MSLKFRNSSKDVPLRRVKRWGFDLRELLNDPIGHEQFTKFLEKEYSGENLKYVLTSHDSSHYMILFLIFFLFIFRFISII